MAFFPQTPLEAIALLAFIGIYLAPWMWDNTGYIVYNYVRGRSRSAYRGYLMPGYAYGVAWTIICGLLAAGTADALNRERDFIGDSSSSVAFIILSIIVFLMIKFWNAAFNLCTPWLNVVYVIATLGLAVAQAVLTGLAKSWFIFSAYIVLGAWLVLALWQAFVYWRYSREVSEGIAMLRNWTSSMYNTKSP